jgi:ribosome-interacting GTPase 1
MPFEDVQIQIVDLPAIAPEFTESWLPQVIRAANTSAMVVDPNDVDVLGELDYLVRTLVRWRCSVPRLVVANKLDLPSGAENLVALEEILGPEYTFIGVSALTGAGLPDLARVIFHALDVVRFYSKPPGRKPDMDAPFVLRRGATVQDAAARVHRELAGHLRTAKLFRAGDSHGLAVERMHVVEDGDILEFHT